MIVDATGDAAFAGILLDALVRRRRAKGLKGELVVTQTPALRQLLADKNNSLTASSVKGEQSNTSIIYGDKAIVKLFRRVEQGVNPELEIGRFLTEQATFTATPPLLGAIEYRVNGREPLTFAVANALIPQAETAWHFALDNIGRYFEQVLTQPIGNWPSVDLAAGKSLWEFVETPPAPQVKEFASGFLTAAGLLGRRTAEMHIALASDRKADAFAPESFSQHYQRSLYQSARKVTVQNLQRLRKRLDHLSPRAQQLGRAVLENEKQLLERLQTIVSRKIGASSNSLPRRLSPGAGAVYRQGLHDHRFRRRTGPLAFRTADQRLTAVGRGRHDSLVPLRRRAGLQSIGRHRTANSGQHRAVEKRRYVLGHFDDRRISCAIIRRRSATSIFSRRATKTATCY